MEDGAHWVDICEWGLANGEFVGLWVGVGLGGGGLSGVMAKGYGVDIGEGDAKVDVVKVDVVKGDGWWENGKWY